MNNWLIENMTEIYSFQHGGAVVSIVTSWQDGSGFEPAS